MVSISKNSFVKKTFEEIIYTDHKVITEELSKAILKKYGIKVPEFVLVTSAEDAAKQAKKLGFPLVMKVVSPQILHKTDVSGVKVGICNVADVKKPSMTCIIDYQKRMVSM